MKLYLTTDDRVTAWLLLVRRKLPVTAKSCLLYTTFSHMTNIRAFLRTRSLQRNFRIQWMRKTSPTFLAVYLTILFSISCCEHTVYVTSTIFHPLPPWLTLMLPKLKLYLILWRSHHEKGQNPQDFEINLTKVRY
jgi:hypothetical protein